MINPAKAFPGGAYEAMTAPESPGFVREKPGAFEAPDERRLQCVWFDSNLRPRNLRTSTGEEVEVENPGRWNLEAGPDFLQAALRIGSDRRRLSGDVEVHIHAADWRRHGHAADPRYAGVKAHVTFYPATLPAESLPPGVIQLSLRDKLAAMPSFSFETIDAAAYPYASHAGGGRCAGLLLAWAAPGRAALLEAAGAERIARKAVRMAATASVKGADQTLYEETLCALGYRHNRAPFRALAARMPEQALREESGGDTLRAYALLCGLAGLLPQRMDRRWDRETKEWVRRVWDAWWQMNARWEQYALTRNDWRLAGLRPPNRPERRIMAAACLFAAPKPFREQTTNLHAESPSFWKDAISLFEPSLSSSSYWSRRWSLGGPATPARVALVGERRAAAMVANVLLPFLAASGRREMLNIELLREMPPEETNSVIKQTAHAIFGPDHSPSIYRTGLRNQGLIHIFNEYCLPDKSACAKCPLPETLARLGNG